MANFYNELRDYQTISRKLIFDNSLSDRARFVYCYMASKPDGWNFFLDTMAKEIGYNIDTLRKYINELISSGWLIKGRQENNGKFGAVEYTLLSNKKIPEIPDTEKTRVGKIPTQREYRDYTENREKEKERKEIYKEIVDYWNEHTKSYSKVRQVTSKIKSAINARIKDGYSDNDIKKALLLCESLGDFYKGKEPGKTWKASFYWIICNTNSNFDKILDGSLHTTNEQQREYKRVMNGEEYNPNEYRPTSNGGSVHWNEQSQCYYCFNPWDFYQFTDGYTNETRPDGAAVFCQGVKYTWSKEKKEWIQSR